MENLVWAIFGVVAFLIAIGIMLSFVQLNEEEKKRVINENALKEMGSLCEFVCNSDVETRFTKKIAISAGAYFSSSTGDICLIYKGKEKCYKCKCKVEDLDLNLNKPEIMQMYKIHKFRCVFERKVGGVVSIECFG